MTTDTADHFDGDDMSKLVGYDMARRRGRPGLRAGGRRPRGHPRRRAARLLHHQRAAHLRGARPDAGGHGREVHPRRRQHLRRPGRHQPVRRPAVQGPPARRHRPRAVHRARLAAARHRPGARQVEGAHARAAAQPRPRRRLRRHPLREGRLTWRSTADACSALELPAARRRRSSAAGCASSPRRSARPTRSTPTSTPRARPATRDLPVPPTFLFGLELERPDPFGCLDRPRRRPAPRPARRAALRLPRARPTPATS